MLNLNSGQNLFLAPMAGYTNLPFRLLAQEYGATFTISEMVSAKGLFYKDKKTKSLIKTIETEKNFGIQLFGSEPKILKKATQLLEGESFEFLDFNIGCPAPKIVKNGDGSALLKNLSLANKCLVSIKNEAKVPVSAKIRIGFNEYINKKDLAQCINDSGIDFLTIHPRTREQYYSGHSDWNYAIELKQLINCPVILSGDITNVFEAKQVLNMGFNGLMIGRAALDNPYIFKQISNFLESGSELELTSNIKRKIVLRHLELFKAHSNNLNVISLRKHLAHYTKGLKNAKELRNKIFKLEKLEDTYKLFEENY